MKMKKIICTILATIMVLSMVACASEKTVVMTSEDTASGVSYEVEFEAKGDIIQTVTQKSTIDLSLYSSEQIEAMSAELDRLKTQYEEIDGVTYTAEVTDTMLVETIVIDATSDSTLEEISDAGLLDLEGEANAISLEKTIDSFESMGFTVIEE